MSVCKLFCTDTRNRNDSEHVLEHFGPTQVDLIAAASFALLKPGGMFRISVPDGYKPSPSYQRYIRIGGTPSGAGQNHMVSWTVGTLPPIFEKVGFKIEMKEYFSMGGDFYSAKGAYDDEGTQGKVTRSFRNDRRNNQKPYRDWQGQLYAKDLKGDEPMYTSLWFDAIKPSSCNYVFSA